jgi:hypothetical protein
MQISVVTQSLRLGLRSRERPVTPTTPATTNPAVTRCAYERRVQMVVIVLVLWYVVKVGDSGGGSDGSSGGGNGGMCNSRGKQVPVVVSGQFVVMAEHVVASIIAAW